MALMNKKKRKVQNNDGDKESGPPAKKANSSKPEDEAEAEPSEETQINDTDQKTVLKFDIKHFRKGLNNVTNRLVGLTQFLNVCTNSDGSVDYILKYLESGGSPGDILKQLQGQNQKDLILATTVFNLFHLMVMKIQSVKSVAHLLQSVEDTCRYFLNTYVPTIELMLNEKSNLKQQHVALKLLTSIVTLNSELGLTVLNQLTLQPKMLRHLVRRQSSNVDVRTSFIQFLMSFLIDGNTTLVKTILDKQGLLAMIMPDLSKDTSDVVLVVIRLLKSSVLNNVSISKTLKICTFTHQVISYVFNLFNWKKHASKSNDKAAEESEVIDQAVEELLYILFTSHKFGIYFTDKTLGCGDVPKNKYLWKAIESLEAPWNNENAGRCIIKILSDSPDLYKPIRGIIEESFDANKSEQWFKTVNFFKSVLTSVDPKQITSNLDTSSLINFIRQFYLPIPILKTSTNVLKSTDDTMRNEIVLLLNTVLICLKNYLNATESDRKVNTSLKNRLEEMIPKLFPSVDILILMLHSILDKVSVDTDNQTDAIPTSKLLLNVLNLLLLYNDIVPNSFDPVLTMLDTKRLFDKIEFLDPADKIELKLKTTTFLLCADRFALAPDKPLFKEILPAMFEVLISNDARSADSARNVLHGILDTTGIFNGNKSEIDIILYAICCTSKKYNSDAVPMIVDVLGCLITNNDKYKRQLSKVAVVTDESSLKSIENFDVIFDNLENYNKNKEELHFVEDRPYFTHFIIGLLKNVKKLTKAHESLQDFSDQFTACLLHFQDNPDRLFDVVKLFNEYNDYVLNWRSEPTSITKNIFDKKTRMFKLSCALLSESQLDVEEVFKDSNADMNQSELNVLLNTVLFYVVRQDKLNVLNGTKLSNAKRALFYIFDACFQGTVTWYIDAVRRCLGNDDILLNFAPFETTRSHLTDFVLDIVTFCTNKPIEKTSLEVILKPYKHKIYLILSAETQKGKGIKFDNIEDVLKSFKLDSNDASSLLSAILDMDVSCMETSANEASSWIYIMCHVIDLHVQNNTTLTSKTFTDITNRYSKIITELNSIINLSELERSIYEYLLQYSNFIETVPATVFETMFAAKHVGKYTAKLAGILLQSNSNLLNKFCKCIVNEDVLSKREFAIPLTLAAFHHARFKHNTEVLNAVYKYYKSNVTKIIEKPQKATQIYVDNVDLFVKLIYYCMDVAECDTFLKKIHKFESMEVFHVSMLEAMFYKHALLDKSNVNLVYVENFLLTLLQLSVVALKRDEPQPEKMAKISKTLNKLIIMVAKYDFGNVVKSTIWQNFFKATLKSFVKVGSVNTSELIGDIARLVDLMYPEDHSGIVELFDMTTSHSEFLNVMLNNQFSHTKTHLVRLLYVMVKKNKTVMKAAHIPVYLSAYQATKNRSDCTLLALLKLYESNGQSMIEYRPYLWSDVGANHFALRSHRKKASLWGNPTVNHVLNLLDKEIIQRTIKHFPIDTKLNSESTTYDCEMLKVIDDVSNQSSYVPNLSTTDVQEYVSLKLKLPKYEGCSVELKKKDYSEFSFESAEFETYDPSFLLPLLNYIVAPGSAVSCHRILRGGILAVPLMALSSQCPEMRSAAYNVLYRFYAQLESEMFYKNDKLLWTQFLDTIRCSLNTAIVDDSESVSPSNPRLPAVCALYLARAALVMTNPLDPLFKPINNVVISKQYVNFSVVPDLLDLFHNTDITYADRRIWILEVLRDGIRTFEDIKVLLKSVTFKILLDYYSCSLADAKTRSLILDILIASVRIPRAAKILNEGYGLLPWLNTTFKHQESKDLTSKNIQLVHDLFTSFVLESASKILNGYEKDSIDLILTGKCFKISEVLQSEILFLLLGLLDRLSSTTESDVKMYLYVLKKLSSVTVKQMSSVQVNKLVRECESVVDPSKKYCRTVLLAIANKKCGLLSTSLTLMNNIKSPTDGETSVKYLHDVVLNWLS